MLRPRAQFITGLIATLIAAVLEKPLKAAFKAVFDVTIQDFWKETITPFLLNKVGPWSTAVLEWIGPYWGGVVSAFALMLVVEIAFAWSRKRRGLNDEDTDSRKVSGRRRIARVSQAAGECRKIAEEMQQFIADQTEMPWSDQGRVRNDEAYTIAFQRHCEARATRFRARFAVRAGEAVERASHLVTVSGLERHDATNFVTAPAIQEMQATVFATLSARLHAMLPVPPSAPLPPRDVQYDLQNNGAEWSLYLTNLGATGDFHVRLDLSSLPSDWPGKPTGAVRGAWGSNQLAQASRRIPKGVRDGLVIFSVEQSHADIRSCFRYMERGTYGLALSPSWQGNDGSGSLIPKGQIDIQVCKGDDDDAVVWQMRLAYEAVSFKVISSEVPERQSP